MTITSTEPRWHRETSECREMKISVTHNNKDHPYGFSIIVHVKYSQLGVVTLENFFSSVFPNIKITYYFILGAYFSIKLGQKYVIQRKLNRYKKSNYYRSSLVNYSKYSYNRNIIIEITSAMEITTPTVS